MKPKTESELGKRWKARELRLLAPEKRDAILVEAATLAEKYYRSDSELTAFDAFGKDELHGDSSNTQPG